MAGVSSLLRNLSDRLFSAPRDLVRLPLSVADETAVLTPVADVRRVASGALPFPGVEGPVPVSAPHSNLDPPRPAGRARLCRLRDAYAAVEFGAVISGGGAVMRSSLAGSLSHSSRLGALPYVVNTADMSVLAPPFDLPRMDRVSVFLASPARFNYAHFLLDGLSGLALLADAGLLPDYPAVCPPLSGWQREAISLVLGDEAGFVREVEALLLGAGELIFPTTMIDLVREPDASLDSARKRILQRLGSPVGSPARLYLSASADERRRLVNQEAVEDALTSKGFTVVQPASLSLCQQATMFRDAEIVVGASGAAMANCLFVSPATRVVELQPSPTESAWIEKLCGSVGARWTGLAGVEADRTPDVLETGAWEAPLDRLLTAIGFASQSVPLADSEVPGEEAGDPTRAVVAQS